MRNIARWRARLANESMVLLKNDGVLPLKTSGIKIAVIGPLADQTKVLLGNYNGIPTHTVSILEGLRKEFVGARSSTLQERSSSARMPSQCRSLRFRSMENPESESPIPRST